MCLLLGAYQIAPKPEERGHCSEVYVTEIGNNNVTVFRQGDITYEYCSNKRLMPASKTSMKEKSQLSLFEARLRTSWTILREPLTMA